MPDISSIQLALGSFQQFVNEGYTPDTEGLECHLLPGQHGKVGVYSNTPGDAGGPTRWGCTLAVVQEAITDPDCMSIALQDDEAKAWFLTITSRAGGVRQVTAEDMEILPRAVADAIYFVKFYQAPRYFRLPDNLLREIVFDRGMGMGTHESTIILQRCLSMHGHYAGTLDGVIANEPDASATVDGTSACIADIGLKALCQEFTTQSDAVVSLIIQNTPADGKFQAGWIWRDHGFDARIAALPSNA